MHPLTTESTRRDLKVPRPAPDAMSEPDRPHGRLVALLVVVFLLAVAVRVIFSQSVLWLDEAQTVAIARLPLSTIAGALRHDGSPPLYYWLLHAWLAVFGISVFAARSLSVLLSILTWPLLWLVTRATAGARPAAVAAAFAASSPFAIFFATEARPYALTGFLTALTALLLSRLLTSASWLCAAGAALATSALLLTHYWCAFLIAVAWIALCVAAVAGWRRRRALTAAAAMTLGAVLTLPWAPTLLFQLHHTGTPWGKPPTLAVIPEVFAQWSAPAQTVRFSGLPDTAYRLALVLACCCFALVGLAIAMPVTHGRRRVGHRNRSGRNVARLAVSVSFGALLLAVLGSQLTHGGYEPRYTAPMFLALPIAAAIGAFTLPLRVRTSAVAVVCALGLAASVMGLARPSKTQAGMIAAAVAANARPGDLVVYCPDQLGPAVYRLLPTWVTQRAFPTGGSAAVVDWVDYAARNRHASPAAFAGSVNEVAQHATIWLVDVPRGYATFGDKCGQLVGLLAVHRRASIIVHREPHAYYEFADLWRLTARS